MVQYSQAEPSIEQRKAGYYSVDDLLSTLNQAFKDVNITVWLALDRLDVGIH